jgi:hypothetical protein
MEIEELLKEKRFDFVSEKNKEFIIEFSNKIKPLNYFFDGSIGSGFERGNYQIIYTLNGIKNSRSVIARIFIRDNCKINLWGKEVKFTKNNVLRLYFSNINKHIKYIENAPLMIKERFIDDTGMCKYCNEQCYKRKTYTINGKEMVKCCDIFEYIDPKLKDINNYVDILNEFYGKKRLKNKNQ